MVPHADAWREPPGPVTLRENEAHVWRARLDCSPARLRELEGLLHGEELNRACRFRFPVHRNRFVSRRGSLRLLLGRYLQIPATDIELEHTQYGKPFLAKRHGTDIRFNLSHSQDLALFVVTRGREAGVDLERVRPGFSGDSVPERFFTPRETAALRALPSEQQPGAFFQLWVCKEAVVKARGMGLSLALDSFDVLPGVREPVDAAWTLSDPDDTRLWTMQALCPGAGYAAALVIEGHYSALRCWSLAIDSETTGKAARATGELMKYTYQMRG